ncbi:MAG: hypothetical protein ILA55_07680, partial [Erysipelotrichaceae bacterium]|nr:hypothetical protein [Erysipelotrichaceae bacterium]
MTELQKRLEEFTKACQEKEKDFKDLILFEYPDLLPNLKEGMAILNELDSDESRKDYVIGIARTREYEYENRPHKIGEYVKTYNYFKSILPSSALTQKEFSKIYKSINSV